MRQTGIGSLTESQKEALNRWLTSYTIRVYNADQKRTVESPSFTTASRSSTSCSPAIETTIDGTFNGWDGETIFKLSNGQIWQQSEYSYNYAYAYRPDVTIFQTSGGCKLRVEDEDEMIFVKRIK